MDHRKFCTIGKFFKVWFFIFLIFWGGHFLSGCVSSSARPDSFSERSQFEVADREPYALFKKAERIEAHLLKNHYTPEGLLAYAVKTDPLHPQKKVQISFADMGIWSGCLLGALAFRYAVTGDTKTGELVFKTVKGLGMLQNITGKKGLLARGIRKAGYSDEGAPNEWNRGKRGYSDYQWLGDVSADQVNGVMFGYSIAFDLSDDEALKRSISSHVKEIADHLMENRMTIQDIDGKRTTHGDFTVGLLSEPLNALIALAIFKSTYRMTGDEVYQKFYLNLVHEKKYHQYAVRARDPWWEIFTGVNHSDNNLAFLAYYTLIRYEKDPSLLDYYIKSLERAWEAVKWEGNPLFTFIYYSVYPGEKSDGNAISKAVSTLYLYREDRRALRFENSKNPDFCKRWWKDRFGREQACFPVPMDKRPADDFEWKENPYRLDGGGDGDIEFSGVDYLLPYWMGRYHGFISEEM